MYPFDRFDEAARQTLEQAQAEAERLGEPFIGTEHLVLAMLRRPCLAGRALAALGVTPAAFEAAMAALERRSPGPQHEAQQVAPTARARKAIELAFQAATASGQRWIGTHHLLLGTLAEGQGVAVRALARLGAGPDEVRGAVTAELAAGGEPPGGPRPLHSQRLWQLLQEAEDLAALEGAPTIESDHVRLAIADAPAMALVRSARDLQVRRQDALEGADIEAAARLRTEEAALRERLAAALVEWRRTAG